MAVQPPDVPDDVADEVDVQHDAGHDRQSRTRDGDGRNREAGDQKVAQQSREDADVTRIEDPSLVGDGSGRVGETEPDGVPVARLETRDEEVIEVDEDPDRGAVDDDGDGGNGVSGDGDR